MQSPVRQLCYLGILAAAALVAGCSSAPDTRAGREDQLKEAEAVLQNFEKDPEMKWFRENFRSARAIIISPRMTRAGFGVGGSGGQAIAFARDPKSGRWAGPAFYSMGGASIGLQVGADVSEVVILALTEKAVDGLTSNSFKFGGDASIAAGPVGVGATGNPSHDMVSFARSKGAYAGLSLEGSVISPDEKANTAYYGKPATPADILIRHTVGTLAEAPKTLMGGTASSGPGTPSGK